MSRQDRLMAAVERLAEAAVLWVEIGRLQREHADAMARGDDLSLAAIERADDYLRAQFVGRIEPLREYGGSVSQADVLYLLAERRGSYIDSAPSTCTERGIRARRHATHAAQRMQRKIGTAPEPVIVHGYGPEWRDLPRVAV